jgi:hypothetical protein
MTLNAFVMQDGDYEGEYVDVDGDDDDAAGGAEDGPQIEEVDDDAAE